MSEAFLRLSKWALHTKELDLRQREWLWERCRRGSLWCVGKKRPQRGSGAEKKNLCFIFLWFSFQMNFALPLSLSAPTTAASPSAGCAMAPTTAATTATRTASAVSEASKRKTKKVFGRRRVAENVSWLIANHRARTLGWWFHLFDSCADSLNLNWTCSTESQ